MIFLTFLRRVRIGVMILDFGYVEIQSFSLSTVGF